MDKINATTVVTDTVEVVSTPIRANRISVVSDATGFTANLYRTHKQVATIHSNDTKWTPKEDTNKTADRENFRQFVMDNANLFNVNWSPIDARANDQLRCKTYPTDAILIADAINLIASDIVTMQTKNPHTALIGLPHIDIDEINPVLLSDKGYDLYKMGVIDGHYEKNGNWAWADLPTTITFTIADQEIYVTTVMQLVSGQLRKPRLTQTMFNDSIKESLLELGLITEEVKVDKSKKVKPTEPTIADIAVSDIDLNEPTEGIDLATDETQAPSAEPITQA